MILTAVNRGARGVAEIAAAVGPRPSVYPLLETLARDGFIVRSESDGSYRPTSSVLDLSDGFRDEAWVTELTVRALRELVDKVLWPSDIATFDGHSPADARVR